MANVACSITNLGAAASQIGFWLKTGGEMDWREAATYATNWDAAKVLLSGSWAVMAVMAVVMAIAFFPQNIFYRIFGSLLEWVGEQFVSGKFVRTSLVRRPLTNAVYRGFLSLGVKLHLKYAQKQQARYAPAKTTDDEDGQYSEDSYPNEERDHSEGHTLLGDGEKPLPALPKSRFRCPVSIPGWAIKLGFLAFIVITLVTRPDKPYDHLSATLPIAILAAFEAEPDFCDQQRHLFENEWPMPELINKKFWQKPRGDFKGWAPGLKSKMMEDYNRHVPDWIPDEVPRGFARWDPKRFEQMSEATKRDGTKPADVAECIGLKPGLPYYNPVGDPLRITNLDSEILAPVKAALDDGSVVIKHVVFVLMESLREELFPIVHGSDWHRIILEYSSEEEREEINERLANLTPNAEKITGRARGFVHGNGTLDNIETNWDSPADNEFGGINIQGAYTTATMSTKSFAANHCGAWPMPVEKFEEAMTDSYQPCMPQILNLFNGFKENSEDEQGPEEFREQDWNPAFFIAVQEDYDRMDKFDAKAGFHHIVGRKQIERDWRYNKSDPLFQTVNYFGFSEPVLKPHIKEYIQNTTAANQRIWMSHFTSTTHHAWDTPDWFDKVDYLPTGMKDLNDWHSDYNKYLQTISFHDQWMGELMQMFDDLGISDETLIVFAGDHGQAFKEDTSKTGTYENGHVSNFRVPITFRHPHLPRYQYNANATTISILPTILDLLINSGSLNDKDAHVASDIVQEYEGQSLIRPYRTEQDGRRAWNFAVVNSGAGMLAVTSADAPYRLVMPLGKTVQYKVADLSSDPLELNPVKSWSLGGLKSNVRRAYGEDAAKWAAEAEAAAQWWVLERQRLWGYHSTPKSS